MSVHLYVLLSVITRRFLICHWKIFFQTFSRDDLKKAIEDNGGKVGSSISSKTDFVIAGANMGPAKLEKAKQLQIAIIDENEFLKMINE